MKQHNMTDLALTNPKENDWSMAASKRDWEWNN